MVIYAVKNTIKMTDYVKRLDSELALKQRLILVIVNVIMVLLLVIMVPPAKELFFTMSTELKTFLVMLVVILSFVSPLSTFILIVILFVSFYVVLRISPF